MIDYYWKTQVWSTGGPSGTKNRKEQTNEINSAWVMEGVKAGLTAMYKDRFDANGNLVESCDGPSGKVYGTTACKSIITTWANSISNPAPCLGKTACNVTETIKCFTNNDKALAPKTGTANCDLVPMKYGYSQW